MSLPEKIKEEINDYARLHFNHDTHENRISSKACIRGASAIATELYAEIKRLRGALEFNHDIDCGDHSCRFAKKKKGMRTNGGCRCEGFFDSPTKVRNLLSRIQFQQRTLQESKARFGGE